MIRGVGLVTGLIFQVVVMRAPTAAMLHVAITAGMANLTTLVFLTWITAPPPGLGGPTLTFAVLLVYYLMVPCSGVGIIGDRKSTRLNSSHKCASSLTYSARK